MDPNQRIKTSNIITTDLSSNESRGREKAKLVFLNISIDSDSETEEDMEIINPQNRSFFNQGQKEFPHHFSQDYDENGNSTVRTNVYSGTPLFNSTLNNDQRQRVLNNSANLFRQDYDENGNSTIYTNTRFKNYQSLRDLNNSSRPFSRDDGNNVNSTINTTNCSNTPLFNSTRSNNQRQDNFHLFNQDYDENGNSTVQPNRSPFQGPVIYAVQRNNSDSK